MAFSSILEGPSDKAIGPYVNQSIPFLLTALSDPNDLVKDTTAWTIGRICDLHVRSIPEDIFPTLVNGLAAKLLTETPRVSSQACFGIRNLAAAFQNDNAAATSGTNALSRECALDVVREPHRSIAGTVDSSNHSSSSEDGNCGGNAARDETTLTSSSAAFAVGLQMSLV